MRSIALALLLASAPLAAQDHDHSAHAAAAPEGGSKAVTAEHMAMMEDAEATDDWQTMVHGWGFLVPNRQDGPSGQRDFYMASHFMGMASKKLGGGKLSLSAMMSLDPLTVPPKGYSLLFQRGETFDGVLLVDYQHPHDLFAELSASWETKLTDGLSARLYVAPVGSPALGPEPFVHRLSSSENPAAPLSHHNQDSTHIIYDVVKLGFKTRFVTVEGSAFYGAEPDENRFNLEAGPLDSYSGRVTVRPFPGLTAQVSVGHLQKPEVSELGNQVRSTASVMYEKEWTGGYLAATFAVGRNQTTRMEWGKLFEWTLKWGGKYFFYGRWEAVDRDAFELRFKQQSIIPIRNPSPTSDATFSGPVPLVPEKTLHIIKAIQVDAFTLGVSRDLRLFGNVETGIGGDVTFYSFPNVGRDFYNYDLHDVYGGSPVSIHGFLRLRFMTHGGGSSTEHHHH